MSAATKYVIFPTREHRSRFVASVFARCLDGSVLDVGCFEAPLRELLSSSAYVGVDIAGKPDLVIDLDRTPHLPFEDSSFRCVLCIDVLEHLDSLHAVFAELVRVASQYVIVSLPNCWCEARRCIERGNGHFVHYGLPPQKPVDRHKWFFSLSQAREFIEGKATEYGLHMDEVFITEKPRNVVLRTVRKMFYSRSAYQNRYSGTLWTVLRKPLDEPASA
jgi:SAM-dependent methyltransferase